MRLGLPTYNGVGLGNLSNLETKAMQPSMVVVRASEIGKSITANVKVAIYGILFDTGKAEVKPDSRPGACAAIASSAGGDGLKN